MQNVYYQLHFYRFRASGKPGRADIAFTEHEAIVKAIGEHHADKAEQLMRIHIRNSFASLSKAQRDARFDQQQNDKLRLRS